ncbi:hypothetical protein BU24DRAFT_454714 [Aaosphaeria arxii CBS 175.79]|uniref:C3H1-type domain-containing protein n=1 Tax=Aaosphaeria arxii CBS 175.79 TaxID=1450172 RepID=A0A6A5XBP7_9PLEO|nr:uncharacterized protein BU24DRAFT_454714 [Aaosphaeria arxii CBS 175.79]KAF2010319.1 hypothetical protein BU24DRAFT_454714 [Aaosphaeria arxii CBS 175.79]
MHMQNLGAANGAACDPLFKDTATNYRPDLPGHREFEQQPDLPNDYMDEEERHEELVRAQQLSFRRILNAPPYDVDLPWDDILKYNCSLEELVLFFPNHVLQWPVLALTLRMAGWDRMFARCAFFINASRKVHRCPRERMLAEPLPCKLKVERAIQELQPTFSLDQWDTHWGHGLPNSSWREKNIQRKPRRFPKAPVRTVSLAEAASYVQVNPYSDREFSRQAQKMLVQKQREEMRHAYAFILQTEPHPSNMHMPPIDGGTDCEMIDIDTLLRQQRMNSYHNPVCPYQKRSACEDYIDCPYSHIEDMPGNVQAVPPPDRARATSRACRFDPRCKNVSCIFEHPKRDSEEPMKACKFDPVCRNRKCIFDHPQRDTQATRNQSQPNIQIRQGPVQACKYGSRCMNPQCLRGHRSPAAPPNSHLPILAEKWCKWNNNCKNPACSLMHSAPALELVNEAPKGTKNQSLNGSTHPNGPLLHNTPAVRGILRKNNKPEDRNHGHKIMPHGGQIEQQANGRNRRRGKRVTFAT